MGLAVRGLFRQFLDNILQRRKGLVDVDRLLHPVFVFAGTGLVETLGTSQVDKIKNTLREVVVSYRLSGRPRPYCTYLAAFVRKRVVAFDFERKDGMRSR